jgi:hypothetical protein
MLIRIIQLPVSATRWLQVSQICFETCLAENNEIAKNVTTIEDKEKMNIVL